MKEDDLFASNLATILNSITKSTQWAKWLGVSSSAISQWKGGTTIPKAENLRAIRAIINERGDKEAKEKFRELCKKPLVHLTDNYEKFRAKTLNDYLIAPQLETIRFRLKNNPVPEDQKEDFLNDSLSTIHLLSLMDEEERGLFSELIARLYKELEKQKNEEGSDFWSFSAVLKNLQETIIQKPKSSAAAFKNQISPKKPEKKATARGDSSKKKPPSDVRKKPRQKHVLA